VTENTEIYSLFIIFLQHNTQNLLISREKLRLGYLFYKDQPVNAV